MISFDEQDDELLCRYLYQGNREAFTAIYNKYWQLLFIHAYKMLSDQSEAMDVVQEVFFRIWNNATRLPINSQLKAYLYAAVRHAILKQIEKSKLNKKFASHIQQAATENKEQADRSLLFKEFQQRIDASIQSLPPRMREIFQLSRNEGLSHKEIALLLDITEHTVKTTIHRALLLLKTKLPSFLYILLV